MGFNPCCDGSVSGGLSWVWRINTSKHVSILVVMDQFPAGFYVPCVYNVPYVSILVVMDQFPAEAQCEIRPHPYCTFLIITDLGDPFPNLSMKLKSRGFEANFHDTEIR